MENLPCQNTDIQIWHENSEDFYSPTIRVTAGNGISIEVGGLVYTLPVREWHQLAMAKYGKPSPYSDGLTTQPDDSPSLQTSSAPHQN